jgi:acetolactate synthase-1/2/3 large subunit
MTGRPAATLLHLGPGFANGIANFHNARRARSPIFNVIGDHASWHRAADPPLASDIASLARPVSGWFAESRGGAALAEETAEAIAAARGGCVATLVVPHDAGLAWAGSVGRPRAALAPAPVADARLASAADRLRGPGPTALFLGGAALRGEGLRAAGRLAAAGAHLVCDTFPARVERGVGRPVVERLPYFPEEALARLRRFRAVILAGARAPVSFFGYPGVPGVLVGGEQEVVELAAPDEDVAGALAALAETVGEGCGAAAPPPAPLPVAGAATPERIAAVVAALQPEAAIVVDEGLTAALPYWAASAGARPHTYLALTGGAIGQGLPSATGAALACPGRKVIALQADGSGLYTLQALWTQAREGLDVVSVVLANRGYGILALELERAGGTAGPFAASLSALSPEPDWVALARGFGVPGVRVDDAPSLARALRDALAAGGPHLIEVVVSSPTARRR